MKLRLSFLLVILFVFSVPHFALSQEKAPSAAAVAGEEAVAEAAGTPVAPVPVPEVKRSDILRFSQDKFEAIKKLNLAKPGASRDAGLREIVSGLLDFDKLSERSLAKRWSGLSVEQRSEYSALFKELVELTYVDKFKKYKMDAKYKVDWEGSKVRGDKATVTCFVKHKDTETEIEINYEWVVAQRWEIQDVLLDGASLADTYQKKYDKMFDERGFDGILDSMRKEIKKLK